MWKKIVIVVAVLWIAVVILVANLPSTRVDCETSRDLVRMAAKSVITKDGILEKRVESLRTSPLMTRWIDLGALQEDTLRALARSVDQGRSLTDQTMEQALIGALVNNDRRTTPASPRGIKFTPEEATELLARHRFTLGAAALQPVRQNMKNGFFLTKRFKAPIGRIIPAVFEDLAACDVHAGLRGIPEYGACGIELAIDSLHLRPLQESADRLVAEGCAAAGPLDSVELLPNATPYCSELYAKFLEQRTRARPSPQLRYCDELVRLH